MQLMPLSEEQVTPSFVENSREDEQVSSLMSFHCSKINVTLTHTSQCLFQMAKIAVSYIRLKIQLLQLMVKKITDYSSALSFTTVVSPRADRVEHFQPETCKNVNGCKNINHRFQGLVNKLI